MAKKRVSEVVDGQEIMFEQPSKVLPEISEETQKEEPQKEQGHEQKIPYTRFNEVVEEKNTYKQELENYRRIVEEQQKQLAAFTQAVTQDEPQAEDMNARLQKYSENPITYTDSRIQQELDRFKKEVLEPKEQQLQQALKAQQMQLTVESYRKKYKDFEMYEADMQTMVEKNEVPFLDFSKQGSLDALYNLAKTRKGAEVTSPPSDGSVPFVESGKRSSGSKMEEVDYSKLSAAELEKILPHRKY